MGRKLKDLTGQRFGKLTVIKRVENINGKPHWLCKCDCGNEKVVQGSALSGGYTKSCGCLLHDVIKPGTRFGRLTVIEPDHIVEGGRGYAYRCKCDCGNEIITRVGNLRSGYTRSCGCLHDELFIENRPDYEKIFTENTNINKIKKEYRKPMKNSTSGALGVSWHKRIKKWQARISFQKRNYHLGYFKKLEDAVAARKKAEEKLFDNFLEWYENKQDQPPE